jgi:hypothetical protein
MRGGAQGGWMIVRRTKTLAVLGVALGALLAGCSHVDRLEAALSPDAVIARPNGPVGHTLDEVVALNGPPAQHWDLPDGRRAYQWQSAAMSATVAPGRRGEIKDTDVSQVTCFYTLYTRPDAKGVVKVVAAEDTKPGCMTLAMVGQSR